MGDADNTLLCGNCGHREYHHRPECGYDVNFWAEEYPSNVCACPAFAEPADD